MINMIYRIIVLISLSTLFCACAHYAPHHRVIQQGNFIKENQLEQIKIGMTKRQVIHIMGSPVLNTLYSDNKLEYVFTITTDHKITEFEKVVISFDENNLVSEINAPPAFDASQTDQ